MKLKSLILVSSLTFAIARAEVPHFDSHVMCSSPGRKIELYLNRFGHPQFGYRYKGIGIISYGGKFPSTQFYLTWNQVDGKPLTASIEDSDGLGSWQLQIAPDAVVGFSNSSLPVTVTEFPPPPSMPVDVKPRVYASTCEELPL